LAANFTFATLLDAFAVRKGVCARSYASFALLKTYEPSTSSNASALG
jgi:hypothetical protein